MGIYVDSEISGYLLDCAVCGKPTQGTRVVVLRSGRTSSSSIWLGVFCPPCAATLGQRLAKAAEPGGKGETDGSQG